MAVSAYFVVQHQGVWKIRYSGAHFGPYRSRTDAIRVAISTAKEAGERGHDSQVLVQDEEMGFRVEWMFAHDPHQIHDQDE